jgi:molecular chaperone GrpE
MSEQDATETDDPPEETGGDTAEATAEEPEADPDAALTEIIGGAVGEAGDAGDAADVPDPAQLDVEAELLDHIRETPPETTARAVALLRERVDALEDRLGSREEEIEELESRLKRKQADFQNYKKRQKDRMEQEKRRATEDLVGRLLEVRDSLARALDQDEDADIRDGVETTLKQFDEQLRRENVERIDPEVGDDVDPERHETLATIAADQPEGTVAEVHRPGYEMAGKIIRPAQVAVSDGSESPAERS